jgi:hypothetical protein
MGKIYNVPKVKTDYFGRSRMVSTGSIDFSYLLGVNINDIILFDNSTQDMIDKNLPILPKNYSIFVINKDGEIQFRPYEYNPYRINVSTRDNIIINIESLG